MSWFTDRTFIELSADTGWGAALGAGLGLAARMPRNRREP
jgi:hypothetical protein